MNHIAPDGHFPVFAAYLPITAAEPRTIEPDAFLHGKAQ